MNNTDRRLMAGVLVKIDYIKNYTEQILETLELLRDSQEEKKDNLSGYPQFESKVDLLEDNISVIEDLISSFEELIDDLDDKSGCIKDISS